MADDLSEDLGDALLELGGHLYNGLKEGLRDVVEWGRDAVVPPPHLELSSQTGLRYSGVVVMDRGRVIAMLAVPVEEARPQRSYRQPMYPEEYDRHSELFGC